MSYFVPILSTVSLGTGVIVSANTVGGSMVTVGSGLIEGGATISEQRIREIDESIRRAKEEKLEPFNGY